MKQTSRSAITETKGSSFASCRSKAALGTSSGFLAYGKTPIKKIFFFLSVFCALALPLFLSAGPDFSFQKYSKLKARQGFSIHETRPPKKRIGSGKIYVLNNKNLYFSFEAHLPLYQLSANVRLRFLGKDGKGNYRIQLDYAGLDNGLPRRASEQVLVDSFLADHGILGLKFMGGKRFLQLSINSKGENRLVTEWGSVELRAN